MYIHITRLSHLPSPGRENTVFSPTIASTLLVNFQKYLLTANCQSRQRESLDAFADSLIANCTECCDPTSTGAASITAALPYTSAVIMLLLHLIMQN